MNSCCHESGACLSGELGGFVLGREGQSDGVEDFGLLVVRAGQVRVVLTVGSVV
ncbi:MAG: hypothetical protein JNL84_08780 [Candidatus Accumulibacter sp.]|nr:hypothetical protein [Accumulibacter sp.]